MVEIFNKGDDNQSVVSLRDIFCVLVVLVRPTSGLEDGFNPYVFLLGILLATGEKLALASLYLSFSMHDLMNAREHGLVRCCDPHGFRLFIDVHFGVLISNGAKTNQVVSPNVSRRMKPSDFDLGCCYG